MLRAQQAIDAGGHPERLAGEGLGRDAPSTAAPWNPGPRHAGRSSGVRRMPRAQPDRPPLPEHLPAAAAGTGHPGHHTLEWRPVPWPDLGVGATPPAPVRRARPASPHGQDPWRSSLKALSGRGRSSSSTTAEPVRAHRRGDRPAVRRDRPADARRGRLHHLHLPPPRGGRARRPPGDRHARRPSRRHAAAARADRRARPADGRPRRRRSFPGPRRAPAGPELLRVEHVSRGARLRDVSLTLHRGEILGVAGLLGAGARSWLARDRGRRCRPNGTRAARTGRAVATRASGGRDRARRRTRAGRPQDARARARPTVARNIALPQRRRLAPGRGVAPAARPPWPRAGSPTCGSRRRASAQPVAA